MIKSIYIHIPFCSHICSYCDFSKLYYVKELVNKYLIALEKELANLPISTSYQTIYIGGGTPSSLSIEELERLFVSLDRFQLEEDYEFTVECNIENITEEKLQLMKKHRVNRISIGIESFHQKTLDYLDRNYNVTSIEPTIELVKKYFSNINADLIYAVEKETISELEEDIKSLLDLNINHISTYSLMIEPNTKLANKKTQYISEDLDRKMYDIICKRLEENGYHHYEISNFSKPGFESKHNMTYWQNKEYYGIGLGASGYIDNIRYTNTKSIQKYLSFLTRYEEEYQTDKLKLENEIMLRLRTDEGIDKKKFYQMYHFDLKERYDIAELIKNGIMIESEDRYVISKNYWYLLNEILLRFIEE